jgi:hypothetical protein
VHNHREVHGRPRPIHHGDAEHGGGGGGIHPSTKLKGAAGLLELLDADHSEDEVEEEAFQAVGQKQKKKHAHHVETAADREQKRVKRMTYLAELRELRRLGYLAGGSVVVGLGELGVGIYLRDNAPFMGVGMPHGAWWAGALAMATGLVGLSAYFGRSKVLYSCFLLLLLPHD